MNITRWNKKYLLISNFHPLNASCINRFDVKLNHSETPSAKYYSIALWCHSCVSLCLWQLKIIASIPFSNRHRLLTLFMLCSWYRIFDNDFLITKATWNYFPINDEKMYFIKIECDERKSQQKKKKNLLKNIFMVKS